jgi:hypothetical protein
MFLLENYDISKESAKTVLVAIVKNIIATPKILQLARH